MSNHESNESAHGAKPPAAAIFDDLDHGRYASVVTGRAASAPPPPDADLATQLGFAEVALYLGRTTEAGVAVAETVRDLESSLAETGEVGALARRSWLLAAEVAAANGAIDDAEARASAVAEAAVHAGDILAAMRARFALGQTAGARGEHPLALERLAAASRLATDLANDFYQGRIAHTRGVHLLALGEYSAAERRLVEAVELLGATEDLRYRAAAQVSLGSLYCELGRFDEAYDLLTRAELRDASIAVGPDPRQIRLTTAKSLLGLGRYEEAVAKLEGLLELERARGSRIGELDTLGLLARAELGRGNATSAERAAAAAVELATVAGTPDHRIAARILLGRVRARLGRDETPDELRAILADVDESGTDIQRAEGRIYLAEALVLESPIESAELVAKARAMPIVEATPWLGHELDRVDRDRLRAPVRVNPDGTLVVDTRLGWPKLKNARETLERYLLEGALGQTRGNAAAAGRLIGETRYQMHYLKRIFERGQGRASRGRIADEEDGTERARRSASRPKRLVRRQS